MALPNDPGEFGTWLTNRVTANVVAPRPTADTGDFEEWFTPYVYWKWYVAAKEEPPPPPPPTPPVYPRCLPSGPHYEIRYKDHLGVLKAIFVGAGRRPRGQYPGGMQSFYYNKRVRTPGQFAVVISGNDDRIEQILPDWQVEFWRSDPIAGLDWYKDFEGFHRFFEWRQTADGNEIWISRGRGYNDLLAAEPIMYVAGSAGANKSGVAETVAKEYTYENVGLGATVPPRLFNGVMPGLVVQADAATGLHWEGGRAYKNLHDVLIELANYTTADFMVVGTGPGTFEFRWKDGQWGTDRRAGSANPLVFSTARRNATQFIYRYSVLNAITTTYMLGQREGANRVVVGREDAALVAASPWARRSVTRNAQDEPAIAALEDRGDAILQQKRPKRELLFTAIQTRGTRYGREWKVGDLGVAEYKNQVMDQKIIGAWVVVNTANIEKIRPEMEDI